MPAYLIHGFRWPRPLIRIHIILQNLDDAAAEWLVAPETTRTLLSNFHELYPDSMEHLSRLRFVEQYDPNDLSATAASQPFAYVADVCEEVRLSVPVNEVTQRGVPNEQWIALMELKDKLAPEEEVGWYVVVCGDEERWAPPNAGQVEAGGQNGILSRSSEGSQSEVSIRCGLDGTQTVNKKQGKVQTPPEQPEPKGLKKLFGSARLSRRKSRPAMAEMSRAKSNDPPNANAPQIDSEQRPPVPGTAA
ncbi:hypothetical protein B0A50_02691 [Salinomyces thailandicus]|uniref:Developmental regulator protein n=1 Tax=Salinomyces thailandicus TaxID=706561 RepID=A0A4U0U5N5_9PEZI|nr:hypothetical protein B0A50_02691 [Salinomyces thailandica]